MKQVEDGQSRLITNHAFAVEMKAECPELHRCLDNPGKALRPICTAARVNADALFVPPHQQAVTVVLNLMYPELAARRCWPSGGQARVDMPRRGNDWPLTPSRHG